jgi:hypothetical protein
MLCIHRFIDNGRALFLAENGFQVHLHEYVAASVTRENIVLLAGVL